MLFLLIAVSSLLVYVDYRKFKTVFTPFNVVSLPLLFVILYAQTLGKAKGYYSVTGEAMGFLLLNFLFLWLPGRFFRGYSSQFKYRRKELFSNILRFVDSHAKILLFFLWVSILSGLFSFLQLVRGYGFSVVTTSFFLDHYGRGILGHLLNFGYPSYILLAAHFPSKINKKLTFVSLAIMTFLVFIGQVSYHLLFPLIATCLIRVFSADTQRTAFRQIIIFLTLGFLAFVTTYALFFTVEFGYQKAISSIFLYIERFRHYLVSGPIGLSQYLANYGKVFDVGDLFAVPVNIYNVVFGTGPMKTDMFNKLWVPISFTDYSNVGTLFGTVYLAGGYGGTLLFSFFWVLLVMPCRLSLFPEEK